MSLLDGGAGVTPTAYLDRLGGLGPDVHVAHGVHVDAADRVLLRERATCVALCTRSNELLGAGTAPVAAYRAEGNMVAVGTDSLASVADLDLLAELRALRALALVQGSPPEGLDRWLVEAATAGGAQALGLDGEVGVLTPGARADLAVVEGKSSPDPFGTVVSGRVVTTVLGGQVVHG
jgi:aminodeoxyfutalosine deaminase